MGAFNFKGFKYICQSSEEDLLEYLSNNIPKIYEEKNCIKDEEFLFAKGNIPVLLVAHLDTVHYSLPKIVGYDEKQGIVWSPEGIGGDDRCGVYAIISIINSSEKYRPSILFTTQEEVGGVGAKTASKTLKDKVKDINFLIEIDRRGKDDAVFYETDNSEFIEFITSFGFKKANGSYSDIKTLSKEWGIASVNLSSAYYNAHTTNEYVKTKELVEIIEKIKKILEKSKTSKFYDFKEKKQLKKNKTGSSYNYDYDEEIEYEDEDFEKFLKDKYGEDYSDPYYSSEGNIWS